MRYCPGCCTSSEYSSHSPWIASLMRNWSVAVPIRLMSTPSAGRYCPPMLLVGVVSL